MTNMPYIELLSGGAKGDYTPHCFFIRAGIDADLLTVGVPFSQDALATYAHEYVHMLHNASTYSGLHLLVANLWLLRSLPHATDADGHFRGQDFLDEQRRNLVHLSCEWTHSLLGAVSWKPGPSAPENVATWKFSNTTSRALHLPAPLDHVVDLVNVIGTAVQADGTGHEFSIDVGYQLISEGVAYEVEKEIRRCNAPVGALLDQGIPPYPYLTFGELLDHWVGRPTTAAERIDLGVYALLTTSPAKALFELSTALRGYLGADRGHRMPYPLVETLIQTFRADAMSFFSRMVQPEVEVLGQSAAVKDAARELCSLFQTGLAIRAKDPVLEHRIAGSHSRESFLGCLATLLDCCVIQSKASGLGEFRWIGPGLLAASQTSVENLVRLQSAMHFAQRHIIRYGLVSTRELERTHKGHHRCPFSGACAVERDEDYPLECASQPWNRYLGAKPSQPVCWYAAGVKALGRARHPYYESLWLR